MRAGTRWAASFGLALSSALAPPLNAQQVTQITGAAVTLYQPAKDGGLPPVAGRVSSKGWGAAAVVESESPAGTTQFVAIRYPGGTTEDGKPVAAGSYWVRKSAVILKEPCAHATVAPPEIDRRAAPNGAGSFCEPAK